MSSKQVSDSFYSDRLAMSLIEESDSKFIFKLVNSPGWLKFIGDRNVKSLNDAKVFIQDVIASPTKAYWVVRLKESDVAMGIVTYIKRTYLEHYDIGFAFLPNFKNQGYAYEASSAILLKVLRETRNESIQAVTMPENEFSIKLLKKLGFTFEKEIETNKEKMLVYKMN